MSTLLVNNISPNSGDTVSVSGSLLTTGIITIGETLEKRVNLSTEGGTVSSDTPLSSSYDLIVSTSGQSIHLQQNDDFLSSSLHNNGGDNPAENNGNFYVKFLAGIMDNGGTASLSGVTTGSGFTPASDRINSSGIYYSYFNPSVQSTIIKTSPYFVAEEKVALDFDIGGMAGGSASPENQAVSQVYIDFSNWTYVNRQVLISGSYDGENWYGIHREPMTTWVSPVGQTPDSRFISFTNTTAYRWYRLDFPSSSQMSTYLGYPNPTFQIQDVIFYKLNDEDNLEYSTSADANKKLIVNAGVFPQDNGLYSLGSMQRSWGSAHIHGVGHIHTASLNVVSSSLIPDADDTYDLGSSLKGWKNIYLDGNLTGADQVGCNTLVTIEARADRVITTDLKDHNGLPISVSGSLVPEGNNSHDLGSSAKQWKDLYVDGIAFIDSASIDSASIGVVVSDLIPTQSGFMDLGSPANKWNNIHWNGFAYGQIVSLTGQLNVGTFAIIPTASIDTVSSSLIPLVDDTYDLGSSAKQWKDLYIDGTANVDAISIEKATAASQDLNTLSDYSVNGSKVEVRAITAAQINDGAFATFKLLNTSIATDSLIQGAFTGNHSDTNMSGSIISVATIAASTASVFIHNETGGAIAADTPFTASFVVL